MFLINRIWRVEVVMRLMVVFGKQTKPQPNALRTSSE